MVNNEIIRSVAGSLISYGQVSISSRSEHFYFRSDEKIGQVNEPARL